LKKQTLAAGEHPKEQLREAKEKAAAELRKIVGWLQTTSPGPRVVWKRGWRKLCLLKLAFARFGGQRLCLLREASE